MPSPMRPPMVAIVGQKHSGKTTTVVQLVEELHRRGRRVMTIKHGTHTFNIDPETTDTYRHYHEGKAERVVLAARDKMALIDRWAEEMTPEAIADRYLSDAEIVVCEGFKQSKLPKIEIFRRAVHERPLYDPSTPIGKTYIGIVTDDPTLVVPSHIRALSFDDPSWVSRLADLVEHDVMHR